MPATALRVEESSYRACIEKYAVDLCRRWRIPRGEVDDVVQEVLTEILASVESFCVNKGDFDTWTRAIAWKVIREHVRDSQRYAKRFSEYHPNIDEHPAPDVSPERYVQRQQAKCFISKAAQKVSSQQMSVFVLHTVDGMSHVEIGETLNISESKSQKCYQRARDRLARCLSGKVLSVMPVEVIGCNDSAPSSVGHSRWNERSHYAGQVAAAVLAFLTFIPSNQASSMRALARGEISTLASTQNDAMYPSDKHTHVQDEPAVLRNVPSVKPEPASLPSDFTVSVPTSVDDKPTPLPMFGPLPSRTYPPRSLDHQHLGR